MDDKAFLAALQNQTGQLQRVTDCNSYTERFGVRLTKEAALELLEARKSSLREQERVEFGEGILPKLIFAFCNSPYIYQDNYADTLGTLQDIFYLYKNESLDELTDDELIEYMEDKFNGECQGSLEYLEETCLERLARGVRRGEYGEED